MKGSIRFILGFLLVMGAVGGMDNPEQAAYLTEQIVAAVVGLGLMFWATKDLAKDA
jgi:hypothetical protein